MCLLVAPGTNGKVLVAVAWIGATVGVTVKLVNLERTRVLGNPLLHPVGLVGHGHPSGDRAPIGRRAAALLFVQGRSHLVGALVLVVRRPDPYPDVFGYHEVWHTMVVVATACYYLVLWSLFAHAAS